MKKFSVVTAITGFLMACADSVPGVSGGTIAYILKRYDMLLGSINTLSSKSSKSEKLQAIGFLANLLIGWIVGFIIAILVINALINNNIYELSSLFIGFILFSIPYVYLEEKSVLKSNVKDFYFAILGIALVVSISYFSGSSVNFWSDDLNLITYIFIFLAGMIAISAMLLPGISGSTVLTIFGLYIPIISAIKELLHLDFSKFFIVLTFGLGILAGIKFASKIISKSLENHRSKVVYLIIGLMIGSIYSIVKGPTTLVDEATNINRGLEQLNFSNFSVIAFVGGIAIMIVLNFIQKKMDK